MNLIIKQRTLLFLISLSIMMMMMTSSLFAQDKLSLGRAIQIGLNNNFGIQILKIEENIIQNELDNINKTRLPRVELFAGQQNSSNNINSPTSFVQGFYTDRGLNLGVDANWIIFEGFKVRIEKSRLEKLNKLSQGNSLILVENTIQAIMLAYYNTLVQNEGLRVQQDAKQRSEERFRDAQFQLKYGKVSAYDVLRFENAMLIDSTNSIIQAKNMNMAMQAVNMAMGNKYYKEYELTDELKYQKETYNFDKLQQKMASLNGELLNQYLNLTLRRNDIGLLRAKRYPTFAINGGATRNSNSTKFPEIPKIKGKNFNFYLNFSVSYNLFDGGELRRAMQEGKLREKIENLKIDEIKQELSSELQNAITNYNIQLQIITINEKVISNLKENVILEIDRYKNGFSSLLDYRSLQQEYLQAEQTRLEAIYELLVSETEILKLTGSLTKYNGRK